MYRSVEELSMGLKNRLITDKLLVLPATASIAIAGYYNGDELVDSVVSVKEKGAWEIVEGEKSRSVSHLYLAYFGGLMAMLDDKFQTDDMFESDLLN